MFYSKPFGQPNQLGTPAEYQGALKHMNQDHTASMRAIVQAHLSLPRPPARAQMITLDSRGFEIEYEIINGFGFLSGKSTERAGVRIPWSEGDQVKGGGKEVRERLVKMVKEAEGKRQKKSPIIYDTPPDLAIAILLIAVLIYISNPAHTPVSLYNHPKILKHLHQTTLPLILKGLGAAHLLESLGMLLYALVRRGSSPGVALLWALTTFPVGFPTFSRFKQLNPSANLQDKKGRAKAKDAAQH